MQLLCQLGQSVNFGSSGSTKQRSTLRRTLFSLFGEIKDLSQDILAILLGAMRRQCVLVVLPFDKRVQFDGRVWRALACQPKAVNCVAGWCTNREKTFPCLIRCAPLKIKFLLLRSTRDRDGIPILVPELVVCKADDVSHLASFLNQGEVCLCKRNWLKLGTFDDARCFGKYVFC